MGLLQKVRRLVSKGVGREYAIRFRLLRSSLSPRSRRAERHADVLLISYPKCGRTWLTMLIARALSSHYGVRDVDYLASDVLGGEVEGAPHIRISHDDNPHWKTPWRLSRSKRRYRHKKVILLVRDPRDVVVSMYFERSRRERAYSGTLQQFLRERKGSLDTILAYYNIWAAERARPRGLCLVRYEDLQADTAGELRRLLRFAGAGEIADAHIEEAVKFASFESMRAMETAGAAGTGRLRPGDPNDAESFKTRRGKVGGHVDYLSPDEIEWVKRKVRQALDAFYGYDEPQAPRAARDGLAEAACSNIGIGSP
jgi:sulfotransferase family protein